MLFTSLDWLVFLLAVFVAHHLAPPRVRRWLMLVASVVFYASWSVPYLSLIGAQLVVDWLCGRQLGRTTDPRARKLLVAASVTFNLGALCVFKYYGLLARTLGGVGLHLPPHDFTLPLAISFYSFESMSYTIDVYRRELEPVRSPLHLALFITWFPHLIAGPIIRPSEMMPQLGDAPPLVTRERFYAGLQLMVVGYAKKLLVADWLARVADPIFAAPRNYTALELLVGVYAYAFQIYCDFSAYTDIARGASRWFGIELPENFDDPYLSTSITDFWRRWHMTLSHWLRDYLYIPLGGNRGGRVRTYVNLALTMLLGGLWHGASWTFMAWGGIHGGVLAVERALGVKADSRATGLRRVGQQVLTFHIVCAAWVMFRATSFSDAAAVFAGIARGPWHATRPMLPSLIAASCLIAGYWLCAPLRARLLALTPPQRTRAEVGYALALGAFALVLLVFGATSNAFIYFQF